MKTTIDIPDALLIRAKKQAADRRQPLRALVIEGLRRELDESRPRAQRKAAPAVRWVTVPGALDAKLDVRDRTGLHDWLRSHP